MTLANLLKGDKVYLTALTLDDLPTIARWQQDAAFLRLFDALPAYPKSQASLNSWLEQRHQSPNDFVFAIRPLKGEMLIGYIELDGVLWTHGACGISVAIGDPAQRGKGYGQEATRLVLAFAFHELNLHRVTWTAFTYNQSSIALAEKLGFQREGTFREFVLRDGRRFDMILFGLLRREWEAQDNVTRSRLKT